MTPWLKVHAGKGFQMYGVLIIAQSAGSMNPQWWAQPVATVAAAIIALLAAWIAWRNVTRQLGNERQKERRAERLAAAVEAVEAIREGLFNVRQRKAAGQRDRKLRTDATQEARSDWHKQAASRHARIEIARARLQLLGMSGTQSAFEKARLALNSYSQQGGHDSDLFDAAEVAIRGLTDVLASEFRSLPEAGSSQNS
ncbi:MULTISPECIES: hypothetical protein [Nocardia]|uniref:hypothetical protein n=1 Tax=Nocardia TaxID=1817 RepID=UPI001300A7F2|nr:MULTISPECIES: hypothetical protein [Nocardia]